MTPLLGRELLSVFLRFNDRAGRRSVTTSIDGKITQREAGQLFEFIKMVIQPLNRYLTTELRRKPLSASRLARFALDDRRRITRELKWNAARPLAKEAAVAEKRRLLPLETALKEVFAIPK